MNVQSLCEHVSSIAPLLLPVLLDAAVKGTAILLVAAVATLLMRRASAAARHWVWFLGVLSLLVLPILSAVLPGWYVLPRGASGIETLWQSRMVDQVPEISPVVESVPTADDVQSSQTPSLASPAIPAPAATFNPAQSISTSLVAPPQQVAPSTPYHVDWTIWALVLWLTGCIVQLGYVAMGFISLFWLGRRASRLTKGNWLRLLADLREHLHLRRRVELLGDGGRAMPMTWGLWRVRVLLPEESANWSSEQCKAVLLHELAHAKRWDCLTQLVSQLACGIHWFNPLVWLAWKRMQSERERACDDLVLSTGAKASAYAEQLLRIATEMPAVRFSAAAIAMARPNQLEGRLVAILDVKRDRRAMTWGVAILAGLFIAAFAVPLAMVRAADEQKADQAKLSSVRRFPDVRLAINNRRYGDQNGSDSPLGATTHSTDGHPGAVSDLSGKFLGSDSDGDVYEFTRRFPADAANPADIKTTTKTITYSDKRLMLFEDDVQRIVIYPPTESPFGQPTTAAASHQRKETPPTFDHGAWNMPLTGEVRFRSPDAAYRPGRWFTLANSDLGEGVQVNAVKLGLPENAQIEEIVKKTKGGDLYEPVLGTIQPIRGTLMAPMDLAEPMSRERGVTVEPIAFQDAVATMSCQEIAQTVWSYVLAHPGPQQWQFKDGQYYAVLRQDGGLSVMDVHGSGNDMYVTIIPIGKVSVDSLHAETRLIRDWKDGGKHVYRWSLKCDRPARLYSGWYSSATPGGTEYEGTGAHVSSQALPAELGLEISIDEKGFFRKMLEGDDANGFDSTAGYVEIPPDSQFVSRALPAGEPVTIDNKRYVTLWMGQWIRNGKAVKAARYLARIGDDNDAAGAFFDGEKDVRRVQLLPGEAADVLGDPGLKAIVSPDTPAPAAASAPTTQPPATAPAAKATVKQEAGSTISLFLDKNAVQMRMAGEVIEAAEIDIQLAGGLVDKVDVHDGLVRLRVIRPGGDSQQEISAQRVRIGADGAIFGDGDILPRAEDVSGQHNVPPVPASSEAVLPDKMPKNRVALRVLSPGGSPMQIDGIKEIIVWIKEGPWQEGPQPKVLKRFADGWVFVDAQMFALDDPRARTEITFISGGHTIHADATLAFNTSMPFNPGKVTYHSMSDPNEVNIDETSGPTAAPDEIAGRVVDARGQPVAGAIFESTEPESAKKNFPYGVSETTDANGVFRLTNVSTNPIHHLFYQLHAPGYAMRWIGDLPVGKGFTVHLYNNTRVRGNLLLPGGAPAAGARLELTTSKETIRQNYGSFEFTATTVADAGGAYDLLLEPGVYHAVITSPSGATANLENVAVSSGAIVALPPQLNPGASLTLRLIDSLTGKPVTGARLAIEKQSPGWITNDPGTERVSDADGRVHWDNLVPGQTLFSVRADGYARWYLESRPARSEPRNIDAVFVEVPSGSAEMKVLMEPAVRITGQVLAPDGSPVAGAVVNIAGLRTGDSRYARSADAQGRFSLQFADLPTPDNKYAIVACDPKERWAHGLSPQFVPAAGLEKTFTIQLTPGGRLHGRVIDSAGKPVARIEVDGVNPDGADCGYYNPRTLTDAQGQYELPPLRAGDYQLYPSTSFSTRIAPPPGYAPPLVHIEEAQAIAAPDILYDGPPPSPVPKWYTNQYFAPPSFPPATQASDPAEVAGPTTRP